MTHLRRAGARRILPALALSAAALLVAGCSATAPSGASSTPVAGGEITFARLSQPVSSLDPQAKTLTTINAYTLDKIFDTLYALDEDGVPQPSLATSYDVSADGLTWTFHLSPGVTFSDGTPFGAKDVVYSIQRHLDLGGALPLAAPVTGVTAEDDATVDIRLSAPFTPLLSELSIFSSSILPADLQGKSEAEFFQDPIGTGPFTVGSWNQASGEFTLAKNTAYRVPGLPYLDAVHIVALNDDNQLVQQLQGGQVQLIDDVPIANVEQLQADPSVTVTTGGSWNSDVLYFNTASGVFADRAVRRAVGYAIDRAALASATSFGTSTPANTYISTSIQYSDQEVAGLAHDVAAAKQELASSTHPGGAQVTLTVDGGSQARTQQAQIIQSALAEIGITAQIKSVDNATFWTQFPAGDYDFALTRTIADTGDPDNVSTWQVYGDKKGGAFNTGWNDPAVDALVLKGRVTPDGDARRAVYSQLQETVAQEVPQLPLAYVSTVKATSAKVHGVELVPNGTVRLEKTWIDAK